MRKRVLQTIDPKTFKVVKEFKMLKDAAEYYKVNSANISTWIRKQMVRFDVLFRYLEITDDYVPKLDYHVYRVGDRYHIINYLPSEETVTRLYTAISNAKSAPVNKPYYVGSFETKYQANKAIKEDRAPKEMLVGDDLSKIQWPEVDDSYMPVGYKDTCDVCGAQGSSSSFYYRHFSNCKNTPKAVLDTPDELRDISF